MLNLDISVLTWIIGASILGGVLSVLCAGFLALNTRTQWIPMLISYAIGAMLGAVFLEILPHAFHEASSIETMTATILFGILLFFVLKNWFYGAIATVSIVKPMLCTPRLNAQSMRIKLAQANLERFLKNQLPSAVMRMPTIMIQGVAA